MKIENRIAEKIISKEETKNQLLELLNNKNEIIKKSNNERESQYDGNLIWCNNVVDLLNELVFKYRLMSPGLIGEINNFLKESTDSLSNDRAEDINIHHAEIILKKAIEELG